MTITREQVRGKDKLLFASNATPASLLLLSSSNASLCVWYVVGSQIFIRKTRKLQTLIQAIEIKVDSGLRTLLKSQARSTRKCVLKSSCAGGSQRPRRVLKAEAMVEGRRSRLLVQHAGRGCCAVLTLRLGRRERCRLC